MRRPLLRSLRSLVVSLGAAVALLAAPLAAHSAEPLSTATAGMWSDSGATSMTTGARAAVPLKYRHLTLDGAIFNALARQAPREEHSAARASDVILPLPLPDGGVAHYRIVETSVMAPELAAKFPEIRTWLGVDVDDPASTVRLDWTPLGFHAMVLSAARGRFFIDPWSVGDTQNYLAYYARDYVPVPGSRPKFMPPIDYGGQASKPVTQSLSVTPQASSGTQLRTYRLAVAATVEYTAFFGGTVGNGQAAIVTAINRVNGIYETEVAVRMVLVANNNLLVYTSSPDPYTNDDGVAMLTQNQTNVTSVIGSANYDIGHVFSTGGGGIAGLGVVCSAGNKARGVTGSPSPVGDGFYVDYVAHEIGHQFAGNHSFNGNADNCGGGNRNASTAYEPGSGSTIMAYAGICGAQDIQSNSDPYFHSVSFDEIVNFTTSGGGASCAVVTATGNSIPVATAPAGGFTIPSRTPFALTGSGSDADGDSLTYNWEEYDLGSGSGGAPGVATAAPFFRSWPASTGPTRIFPRLSNLLAGTLAPGEVLPNTTRTLNFRLTVRDNQAGGGGVSYAPLSFNVTTTAGPFQVTAPNTAVNWPGGSSQTVTWNVANTAGSPVNCANVDILLSTDGGNTYPTTLAAATPNDGSQSVTLPSITTTTARVMVACSTSIFFDVSNVNFTIGVAVPGPAATTGNATAVTATGATLNGTATSNGASTTVNFQYGTTVSYGSSAAATQSPLASGASNAAVSATVTGLTCNTLYHFRTTATNANGTANGGDGTFTTAACLPATSTSLVSDNNPSISGSAVTFTATVNGTAPTGNVTFRNGAATVAGCSAVALTGAGNSRTAACTTSALPVGTASITATYNGDGSNAASTSSTLSQVVQSTGSGVATIVANPYGTVVVSGVTLNGNMLSGFTSNAVIELGSTPGTPGSFAQIDFQGLVIASGRTITLRSGAAGQTVLLRNVPAALVQINGTLRAQVNGANPPPQLRVVGANGITVTSNGLVEAPSGLELSALGATPTTGQLVQNAGTIDGGPALVVTGSGIRGGGAFKGNAIHLGTFGNANNPVNGNDFLANGLQLYPSSGNTVALTLNAYGSVPQVLNLKINGNGTAWMPSSWPQGSTLPPNNPPLAPNGVRPPGTPAPSFGGGSMILQATGGLTLVDGGTHDFAFPGAIVLKAGGALDLAGVLVNQGWTGAGQQFQGIFLESPQIVSPAGNIRLYTNFPNWVNFSTLPQAPVRAFTLMAQPDGSESFVPADASVPHQNTFSVIQGIAAAGGCWLCAVNTQPIDVYGP